jgi:hypothetical protein
MPPSPLLAALLSATLLAGCVPSFSLVSRQPDPSLLAPCVDPVLVEDPDTATDNDIAGERIRVAEAYLACKQRQADLARFVVGEK